MLLTLHCPAGEFHLDVPTGWTGAQLQNCLVEASGSPHLLHQELHTVHGPLPPVLTTGTWPLVPGVVLATSSRLLPATELAHHRRADTQEVVIRINAGAGYGQLFWLGPGEQVSAGVLRLRLTRRGRLKALANRSGVSGAAEVPVRVAVPVGLRVVVPVWLRLRGLRLQRLPAPEPVPQRWGLTSNVRATHGAAITLPGLQLTALRVLPGVAGSPPPCCAPAQGTVDGGLDQFHSGRAQPAPTPQTKRRRSAWFRAALMLVPSLAMLAVAWVHDSMVFAFGAAAGVAAVVSSLAVSELGSGIVEPEALGLSADKPNLELTGLSGPLELSGPGAYERAFAAARAVGGAIRLAVWHPRATSPIWGWNQLLQSTAQPTSTRTCHIIDLTCGPPAGAVLPPPDDQMLFGGGPYLSSAQVWLAHFQQILPPEDLLVVVGAAAPIQDSAASWWAHQTDMAALKTWARAVARQHGVKSGAADTSHEALLPDLGITAEWQHDTEVVQNSWAQASEEWFVNLTGPGRNTQSGLDLVTDGPHALVAGTTGSGKSALLRTWLLALCAKHSPRHLQLALIDYKGTGSFGGLVDFPHVSGSANNLDRELTLRAFGALSAEVLDRQKLLSRYAVTDFLQLPAAVRPARLIFAVDEAAALLDQHPELSQELKLIAAQGRSLGIHLILATQRAGSAISAQVRANISLRICLRVADSADSLDVLDHPGAAELPATAPGSALVSVGGAAPTLLRAAQNRWAAAGRADWTAVATNVSARPPGFHTELPAAPAQDLLPEEHCLNLLAATMRRTAEQILPASVTQLWRPPLPELIHRPNSPIAPAADTMFPPIALGIADLLPQRRQPELCWLPERGHLLISGGPGSGRSSALLTVGVQAQAAGFHVDSYGLDADLSARLAPGGTHLRSDPTGLLLLVQRFELAAVSGRPYLLLLDGWTSALQDLAALPRGTWSDQLESAAQLRGSARLGITTSANPGSLSQIVNQRLVLRCPDPTSLVFAGVPSAWPAPSVPGRAVGMGFAPSSIVTAQLYLTKTAPAQLNRENLNQFPRLRSLPLDANFQHRGAFPGVIGPTAAPLEVDPKRSVLLVAPQGAGHDHLLENWPQAPGGLVISQLDKQLQELTISETDLEESVNAGTPLVATVATHALVNAYSGILAALRRTTDLIVLDPLSDGGLELLDPRHHYLTSALVRGRADLGIYRQDSRAWQVQLFGNGSP